MNDSREIGKTLLKRMGLFYALTIIALLTGLAAVFLLQPGAGKHIDPTHLDATVAAKCSRQVPPRGFTEFVLHIIPSSFFGAFAEGEVLPVLLLSVLCGFGLARIGATGRAVLDGIDGFSHMLFAAFGFIMRLDPLGAFGAMAFTVGRYGIKSIGSLGLLIGTFYIACTFFVVVVLGLLARLHGFKLWQLLRYIREELLVVLGTSSSEPVLPRLLINSNGWAARRALSGWCCRPLLVRPRRHRDLPDADVDVHRPGLRHPPVVEADRRHAVDMMLLIAELKEIGPSHFGHKAVIKHMPDQAFAVDSQLYARLTRRFEDQLALWSSSESIRMITAATFEVSDASLPVITQMSLVPVTAQWLPVEYTSSARKSSALLGSSSFRPASTGRTASRSFRPRSCGSLAH